MTEISEVESGELVVVKDIDIPALFKEDGCDPIIEGLKKKAAEFEGDIETAKGRKAIASFARKFSTSKAYLDKLGKALSDEYREKIKPINAERNKIEACCDELRDEVRKPLTDWENAEKKRVADIEERIHTIEDFIDVQLVLSLTSADVKGAMDKINAIIVDESFEEFELAATKAKANAVTQLEAKFIVLQNAEKGKAEAERLEKERLETEREEREKKIAKEAAEKATREVKAKAKEKEAKSKQAIIDAKAATEKAECEKKEAEAKAAKEKKEAAEKAEREKEAAVEEEKQRQADQIKADKEAEEKRQANKRHRNKIHKEVKASLLEHGVSEEDATIFVTMVKDGLVKHIKIDY